MLQFRNLSLSYRIGIYLRGGQPVTINLRPGETMTLDDVYMRKWRNEVKAEIAMYVEKGVLEVYDTLIPKVLTVANILAYA